MALSRRIKRHKKRQFKDISGTYERKYNKNLLKQQYADFWHL
jgi:hypothetical protein